MAPKPKTKKQIINKDNNFQVQNKIETTIQNNQKQTQIKPNQLDKKDKQEQKKIEKQENNVRPPQQDINQKNNLPIVREASITSEEAQSRQSVKRPHLQSQQQKSPPQSIPQEDDIIYDQYNVLKISGLLDAYQHFLKLLCKHGLPTGKVYEYAAQEIQKYEKRKINKELKMRAELDIQKISRKTQKSPPPTEKSPPQS